MEGGKGGGGLMVGGEEGARGWEISQMDMMKCPGGHMECFGGMRLQSFLTLFTRATPGSPASMLLFVAICIFSFYHIMFLLPGAGTNPHLDCRCQGCLHMHWLQVTIFLFLLRLPLFQISGDFTLLDLISFDPTLVDPLSYDVLSCYLISPSFTFLSFLLHFITLQHVRSYLTLSNPF